MSANHATTSTDSATPSRRGQSLVEFALVLPMLIVLLLGIIDFGRAFSAGITVEAAARNAAEAAAQEYVQRQRNDPDALSTADYDAIRKVAHEVACEEAVPLGVVGSGWSCSMPVSAVCIHDDTAGDAAGCGSSSAPVPSACTSLSGGWTATNLHGAGQLPYVEVRICYQFKSFISNLQLPLSQGISVGDFWLEKSRFFVAGDY